MFVPHNGGGLVSVQFRSLVTNTAMLLTSVQELSQDSLSIGPWLHCWSCSPVTSLAFFFENLHVRELLVKNWWCYNQDRWCAQCPVQLKSKVSILLNEGLAVMQLSHVWSWRHPNSEWLIYSSYTFRRLLFLALLGAQEITICTHLSVCSILVCLELTKFIFLAPVSFRSLPDHS